MNNRVLKIAAANSLFLLASLFCFAQDEGGSARKLRFGLKGEPVLSWLKPDLKGVENAGIKFGFNYGLMTDFSLNANGNYAISTGLEVSNIGGNLEYPGVTVVDSTAYYGTNKRAFRVRYVNLPLQLKLRTNEIGYMTYFGAFGVEGGINIRSVADNNWTLRKTAAGDVSAFNSNEEDIKINDDIHFARVALVIGAGFEYNLTGNTSIMVGVSFHNGFTNVLTYDGYEKSGSYEGPALDANGIAKPASLKMDAISNYFALNLGIFF